jgi:hypothetical protein
MPRFMVAIKANEQSEAGMQPSEQLQARMSAYNDELVRAGVRLSAEGLWPSSKGARVEFGRGTVNVVDGPFTEAKEAIGGFWIFQCKSLDECIEWVKRVPVEALPGATGASEIVIQQIIDWDDFNAA